MVLAIRFGKKKDKIGTENEAMKAKFSWLDQPIGQVQGCTQQYLRKKCSLTIYLM